MTLPLPIVAGVGPSSRWLPEGSWRTILDFLVERYPRVDVSTWEQRMAKGCVLDERGVRLNSESPYRVGACIHYYREVQTEKVIPFLESVLYEDEHILVVDKPHFLPVVPSGRFLQETLLVRLRKQGGAPSLVPIHRLDRDTAGIVLFSLNPKTRGCYTSLFRERKIRKVYEALAPTNSVLDFPFTRRSRIVRGEPFFRMKEVDGEPNSETRIEVLDVMDRVTLYKLIPVSGRKHQLRLHLAALGIPIANDRIYPEVKFTSECDSEDDFSSPLKLLARSISFRDPISGRQQHFESGRKL